MKPAVGNNLVRGRKAVYVLISHITLILTDESTASNRHSFLSRFSLHHSLLLRLPQEIQDQIYKLVCGGNLLHFEFTPAVHKFQRKLCHVKSLSKITEAEAQASFFASTSPWFDEVCAHRHEECDPSKLLSDQSGCMQRGLTLDLRFLRTCRQIYHAAKTICYGTNIFSFDSLDVFMEFGKTRSWISHIRSLRLRIQSGNSSSGPAFPDSLNQILGKLTCMKWIHIDLEQIFFDGSRVYEKRVEENSLLTKQLLCFGGRALKVAAVVISDARFCDYKRTQDDQDDDWSLELGRWTMKEKQEYAHFLRNALLEHRGKGMEGYMGDSRLFRVWSGTVYA